MLTFSGMGAAVASSASFFFSASSAILILTCEAIKSVGPQRRIQDDFLALS